MRSPDHKTVGAVAAFVLAVVLLLTLNHTNNLLQEDGRRADESIRLATDADEDRLRAEYQRVLLGCNTAGAVESSDRELRLLCDEELVELREALEELNP